MKIQKRFAAVILCIALLALGAVMFTSCGDCDHDWSEWTVTKDATCVAEGEEQRVCQIDSTHVQTRVIEKADHKFENYKSDGNIGCTTNGTKTASCMQVGCQATSTILDEAIGHTFTEWVFTDADCTSPSRETSECDVCGEVGSREIANADPALGHTYGDDNFCDVCGVEEGLFMQFDISADENSNVIASLYKTGKQISKRDELTLVITGTGAINVVVDGKNAAPWNSYVQQITSVKIADTVTNIGIATFYNLTKVASVKLPAEITSIPEGAFSGCESLTSIDIPATVKFIGYLAFSDCDNLATVNIADNSELDSIFGSAFQRCKKLSSINLPDGVVEINEFAFADCAALTSLNLTENLVIFYPSSFERSGLTETEYNGMNYLAMGENPYAILIGAKKTDITEVAIHKDTVKIACAALATAPKLVTLTVEEGGKLVSAGNCIIDPTTKTLVVGIGTSVIPNDGSVTSIGTTAFLGCASLKTIIIPASVEIIESYAFANTGLEFIILPKTVKELGYGIIAACQNLSEVSIAYVGPSADADANVRFGWIFADAIPENVKTVVISGGTEIGYSAFRNCSTIENIYIPKTITSIRNSAFAGCTNLKSVNINDLTAWCHIDFQDYYSNPLYYAKSLYINGKLITELTIPEGTTHIGFGTFAGCAAITKVTLPSTLTYISGSAFKGCTGITEIVIPDSIETIDSLAFANCASLNKVTLSAGLTAISELTFSGCDNIIELTIPANVTSIDFSAFTGCKRLKYITVDEANEAYVSYCGIVYSKNDSSIAFIPHAIAGTVELLDGLTEIKANQFADAPYIDSLIIPASVKTIAKNAFAGCTTIKSIIIPFIGGSLEDAEAFSYVFGKIPTTLSTVTITGEVSIAKDAFRGITSLKSVTLNEGVTTIAEGAFADCSVLAEIVLPKSVTAIEKDAFANCRKLISVYYRSESSDDYATITVGENNVYYKAAKVYYEKAQPENEKGTGDNWYYDEKGEKTIW